MAIFDYISSDEFRQSLEADYQEMVACFNAKGWKAVHVLAGSIVEAVLLDYILVEGYVSQEEAFKMDLGSAINLCKERKVISEKTSDLSSVIKSYRNLIHPGRLIRLNEQVDKNSAEVAKALVGIVVNEIEKQKREKYGYTAEQIVAKIQRDSTVSTIIGHIIKNINPIEVEKLLLKVLPNAYMEYLHQLNDVEFSFPVEHFPTSFSVCFRTAFEQARDEVKKKVSQNFARIIREESEQFIFAYGKLFFRAPDMRYLSSDDIEITKNYLLGRLENDVEGWMPTISGIYNYLSPDDVNKLVDPLVRVVNGDDNNLSAAAARFLKDEGWLAPQSVQAQFLNRLGAWVDNYRKKNLDNHAAKIENIREHIALPI